MKIADLAGASAPLEGITNNNGVSKNNKEEKPLREAAENFESLLINEMLKSMRRAVGAGEKAFGESTFTAMLDEKFAQNIAESRGFGLADSLVEQIRASTPQDSKSSVDTPSEGLDVSAKLREGGPS